MWVIILFSLFTGPYTLTHTNLSFVTFDSANVLKKISKDTLGSFQAQNISVCLASSQQVVHILQYNPYTDPQSAGYISYVEIILNHPWLLISVPQYPDCTFSQTSNVSVRRRQTLCHLFSGPCGKASLLIQHTFLRSQFPYSVHKDRFFRIFHFLYILTSNHITYWNRLEIMWQFLKVNS